jgi:hypothetical protein
MWHKKPPLAPDGNGTARTRAARATNLTESFFMRGQVPEKMRFVDLLGAGGPEVLEIRAMPTPEPQRA